MKPVKLKSRLALAKETLRTLADPELGRIAGGSDLLGGPDKTSTLMFEDGCYGHSMVPCPIPTTTHAPQAPCR
jgi:hypothetical protein